MEIVISSRNQDKIGEIVRIFKTDFFKLRNLSEFQDVPEVIEDGNTLEENALKKAKLISEALGMPAIADDTGLEVDALNGRPGVFSARYAGEHSTYEDNVQKLLKELEGVPPSRRSARFRCVAAFVNDNLQLTAEGSIEGRILSSPRGTGGFGYDPVFFLPGLNKTFAQMSPQEKNAISHRGLAFRKLYQKLITHFNL